MKTEKGDKLMYSEPVNVFKYKDRICCIVKVFPTYPLQNFHNGYVSVLPENYGKHYDEFIRDIITDELTFSGELWPQYLDEKLKELWFLGFDSAHHWNDLNPESKTFKSVKERTIALADEMIEKSI